MNVIHLPCGHSDERVDIINGIKKARNDAEMELKKFSVPKPTFGGIVESVFGPSKDKQVESAVATMLEKAGLEAYKSAIQRYTRMLIALESNLPVSITLEDYGAMIEWSKK